jgi:hypothetical protein
VTAPRTFALVAMTFAIAARAAALGVDGNLTFPGSFTPAMLVYAREVDNSKIQTLATRAQQTSFHFDLPPGRYVFFAEPDEAGAPMIYGAHTLSSACKVRRETCGDHRLDVIAVSAKAAVTGIVIDDWDLPDQLADQLDHDLGITASPSADELGAPRFSEYPSGQIETPARPAFDFGGTALPVAERARLQQALQDGPNFAGAMSAVFVSCGNGCNSVAFLDWHSGKVTLPAALANLDEPLPCRSDESLQFRRDSQLLSVTRKRGAHVTTQYFVWNAKAGTLTEAAEYQRSADRFCSTNPR